MRALDPTIFVRTGSSQMLIANAPEMYCFDPREIANGLWNQIRFNGQHHNAPNVLQHSFLVAELARAASYDDLPFYRRALLHDASEAYLSDLNPATKALLPDYQRLEARYMDAINKQFRADGCPIVIRHFDLMSVYTEMSAMPSMCHEVTANKYNVPDMATRKLEEIRQIPETILKQAFIDVLRAKPNFDRWLTS